MICQGHLASKQLLVYFTPATELSFEVISLVMRPGVPSTFPVSPKRCMESSGNLQTGKDSSSAYRC